MSLEANWNHGWKEYNDITMEDIARELYECLTERIYSMNPYPASMGASSRERQAMDAFLNRGYEVVKPDAD
jgi:hypothetical protein